MTSSALPTWALLVLLVAAAFLYSLKLDRSPVYLNSDEAMFSVQAHALATTGRDDRGRLWPVYFQMNENVWYQPSVVYAMAPLLAFFEPTPPVVRLPTVLVAMVVLVLVYALANRVGVRGYGALAAPVFLALTPAFFLHARLACDYMYPLPFVLAWMLSLIDYLRSHRIRSLVIAGVALGCGFYTYVASMVMMPLYLGLTLLVLAVHERRKAPAAMLVAIGSFLFCLLPLAVWLWRYPDFLGTFLVRYVGRVEDAPRILLADGMPARLRTFVSFFEPSYLFEVAESSVMSSTYTTGVFLAGARVLMAAGLYHMLRHRRSWPVYLTILGFLTAPAAASLVAERYATDRALALLPFGAIIAAFGVEWLLTRRGPALTVALRIGLVATTIWMVVQFGDFHRDYFHDYRRRAAFWFNNNHPGAFAPILNDHGPGDPRPVYLSARLPFIRYHWHLRLLQQRRTDLLERTVYFDVEQLDLDALPVGTTLLTNADAADERWLLATGRFHVLRYIYDFDGAPRFTHLSKHR
jgi:4-amino-4-deoxy-L-arabinose transferase-like glycosyltransferase